MTNLSPKDKAKELFDKYYRYEYSTHVGEVWYSSKQCALICCNEILEGLAIGSFATTSLDVYEYWQQVKAEIEKL
jgi:hypothetical protein